MIVSTNFHLWLCKMDLFDTADFIVTRFYKGTGVIVVNHYRDKNRFKVWSFEAKLTKI